MYSKLRQPRAEREGRTREVSGMNHEPKKERITVHGWKNFVFPNHENKEVLCLMTCSYIRNSVWRKQNCEWLSRGSILQIDKPLYIITKSMRALWLVHELWVIMPVDPWKYYASSELLYNGNRPQVSMSYKGLKLWSIWSHLRLNFSFLWLEKWE